jgi:hypothetical protein
MTLQTEEPACAARFSLGGKAALRDESRTGKHWKPFFFRRV